MPIIPPSPMPTVETRPSGLRDLADSIGLLFGIALETYTCEVNPSCKAALLANFNSVTISYGIHWPDDVEPVQGHFDYSYADSQLAFALEYDLVPRGHPLLFPTDPWSTRGWIRRLGISPREMSAILEKHVSDLVGHYRQGMAQWVVVNEPYIHPWREDDIFYQALGYKYIDNAFRIARAADPSAILIYSDTDNHIANGMTTQLTLETVKRLKAEGIVDAVGLQMHLDAANPPARTDVINTMRAFGLPVYVTELSAHMLNVGGSEEYRREVQAALYAQMLQACLESGVCRGVTIWTLADVSPLGDPLLLRDAPGIFDSEYLPKPAYYAIREVLQYWAAQVSDSP